MVRARRLRRRRGSSTTRLRRYLAYLQTAGFARPSIAARPRRCARTLRYLRAARAHSARRRRRVQSPKGARRLPRMPRRSEAVALLDDAATTLPPTDDPRALARPRDPRAALRRGPAGQRVLRPRRRRRRPPQGDRHRARQGRQGAAAPARRARARGRRPLRRSGRAVFSQVPVAEPGPRAAPQRPGAAHDAPGRPAGARPPSPRRRPGPAPPRPAARLRHPPARGRSRSRELFRSCSDTPMWERHRSTLT